MPGLLERYCFCVNCVDQLVDSGRVQISGHSQCSAECSAPLCQAQTTRIQVQPCTSTGSLRDTSGTSGEPSGPCSPTTTLNRSTADPCSLHPTHVLTGEPGFTRAESEDSRRTIVHSTAEPSRSLHSTVIRWTWRAGRTRRQRVPHRYECRYANPSTAQPGGHFDPLFRWPTKAGNRAR